MFSPTRAKTMSLKQVDGRVIALVKRAIRSNHRSFFVIVGDRAPQRVPVFYELLSTLTKVNPKVLWCYQKELSYDSHGKARKRKAEQKVFKGNWIAEVDVPMMDFLEKATNRRQCKYSESAGILGQTYDLAVLQDFQGLTPNLLCRVTETVAGGGMLILLVNSVQSLRELYTVTMHFHKSLASQGSRKDGFKIQPRFNRRFILSLADCTNCMLVDDEFNVLPISSHMAQEVDEQQLTEPIHRQPEDSLFNHYKESDSQAIRKLMGICRTVDQALAVREFIMAVQSDAINTRMALLAPRGRGKSAALGLVLAAAVLSNYSRIVITAPYVDNVKTVFEFVGVGLKLFGYQETVDYRFVAKEVDQSPEEARDKKVRGRNKQTFLVLIKKGASAIQQTIGYESPSSCAEFGEFNRPELLVIDEAAAIPLPLVRSMLKGKYFVFISSTVSGYEGTGRALSLKLIKELEGKPNFKKIQLKTPIRYSTRDPIEQWMNRLLCLNAVDAYPICDPESCPPPSECKLYEVNRDTLFAYQKHPTSFSTDAFLRRVVGLFVHSHYRNSPDDLLKLADAPAHRLFCLLGPRDDKPQLIENEVEEEDEQVVDEDLNPKLPTILCAMQVVIEGNIDELSSTKAGDQVPHKLSEEFDESFGYLHGARVFRIAVHPMLQGRNYGTRALALLEGFLRHEHEDEPPTSQSGQSGTASPVSPAEHATGSPVARRPRPPEPDPPIGHMAKRQATNIDISLRNHKPVPTLLRDITDKRSNSPFTRIRVNYLSSSFGLTKELVNFWCQKNKFKPVYLSPKAQEQTGEYSLIVIKPLNPCPSILNPERLLWFTIRFRVNLIDMLPVCFQPIPLIALYHLLLATKNELPLFDEEDYPRPLDNKAAITTLLSTCDLRDLRDVVDEKRSWASRYGLLARVFKLVLSGQMPTLLHLDGDSTEDKLKKYLLLYMLGVARFDSGDAIQEELHPKGTKLQQQVAMSKAMRESVSAILSELERHL